MPFFNLPQSGTGIPALSGSGAPGSTLGVNGQLYIDTASNTLYGPKQDGAWGSGIPLTGASWAELTGKPLTFAPSTHQHPISDVTSLQSSLDGKAASAHGHSIASVTGLQTALDGKAATTHQHTVGDVTGLQAALDAKQSTISSFVASVSGRTGAVTLTASDVGLGSVNNTTDVNKPVSNLQAASDAAVQAFSIQRVNHTGTQAISTVTGLQTALDGKQVAGNYATLVGGQVPSSMLPSFVDDVVDVGTTLPSVGETGKIYVISSGANANKVYRWSGSVYVEISPSPGTTTDVPEGSNLYFTNARASAAAPVQSVAGRSGAVTLGKADVGLGNVDNTRDVDKPVSAAQTVSINAAQASAIQRSNHSGTQLAATISDFATQVAKYAPVTSVNGQTGNVTVSGGSGNYTLPPATVTTLGGIIVGNGLSISNGVLSGGGSTDASALSSGTVAAERLPLATTTAAGAVIIGNGLTIANGVLSRGNNYDPAAAPGAPSGIYYEGGQSGYVRWTASPGGVAVSYELQFTANDGGSYSTAGSGITTTYSAFISGYKFRVRGFNADNLAGEWGYQEGLVAPSGSSGGGGSYTLPTASATVLGGIKIGANLTITDGVLSATGGSGGSGSDSRWDLFLPPAPTNVIANGGNQQATVSWTAPVGVIPQAPVTDYVVQFQQGGGPWETFVARTISITSQPSSQTASSGAATFSVTASVTPSGTATYQWERSNNGGSTFVAVSGATSATLSRTGLTNASDNNDRYRVVVSAVGAASVTSNSVTLTVASSAPTLSLAGTRPSNLSSTTTENGYTLTGTGAPGNPAVLRIGGGVNNDYRVWLLVSQTGTLNWTVTASSEQNYDGGRLYSHSGPTNYTASGFNQAAPAGYTPISSWRSGTQTETGTLSVNAGQHIVLQWTKDSEDSANNDRIELSAFIS